MKMITAEMSYSPCFDNGKWTKYVYLCFEIDGRIFNVGVTGGFNKSFFSLREEAKKKIIEQAKLYEKIMNGDTEFPF